MRKVYLWLPMIAVLALIVNNHFVLKQLKTLNEINKVNHARIELMEHRFKGINDPSGEPGTLRVGSGLKLSGGISVGASSAITTPTTTGQVLPVQSSGENITAYTTATTSQIVIPDYYYYGPAKDITAYELAVLTPLLLPNDASGSQVDWRYRRQPGWPLGLPILSLSEYRIKDLGAAARHLHKLPPPSRGPLAER